MPSPRGLPIVDEHLDLSHGRPGPRTGYSSRVQQRGYIHVDAGGCIGTSDLLKQLIRMRLPLATDQKVQVSPSPQLALYVARHHYRIGAVLDQERPPPGSALGAPVRRWRATSGGNAPVRANDHEPKILRTARAVPAALPWRGT